MKPVEFLVWSNGESAICARICDELGFVHVASAVNVGFASAVNELAARVSGEYLLFLNPDTSMDAQTVFELAKFLDNNESLAAVAPMTGRSCAPGELAGAGYWPSIPRLLREALLMPKIFVRWRERGLFVRWDDAWLGSLSAVKAEWLSGACLLVRRSSFETVDGLPARWFMYGEDLALSWNLRRSGQGRALVTVHVPHMTGSTVPRRSPVRVLQVASLVDFYARFISRRSLSTRTFAGLFMLWCLTHPRGGLSELSDRIKLLSSVVVWGPKVLDEVARNCRYS